MGSRIKQPGSKDDSGGACLPFPFHSKRPFLIQAEHTHHSAQEPMSVAPSQGDAAASRAPLCRCHPLEAWLLLSPLPSLTGKLHGTLYIPIPACAVCHLLRIIPLGTRWTHNNLLCEMIPDGFIDILNTLSVLCILASHLARYRVANRVTDVTRQ